MAKNEAILTLKMRGSNNPSGDLLPEGTVIGFGYKDFHNGGVVISGTATHSTSPSSGEFYVGTTLAEQAENIQSFLEIESSFLFDDSVVVILEPEELTIIAPNEDGYFFNTTEKNDYIDVEYSTSYRERLFYEFTDYYGFDKRVSVLDNEYTGEPVEVIGSSSPFIINYPVVDVFDVIKGSGATLEFIYKGDESFIREIFTSDINRFRVEVIDLDTETLDWSGVLNTELYEEEYSNDGETVGIQYSITANDGFSNLSRYTVLDKHSSVLTAQDVIKICLPALQLDTEDIRSFDKDPITVSKDSNVFYSSDINLIDRYERGTSNADSIFNHVYLNKTNYLDEDGEYLTLKELLEGVLKPYRLHIVKIGGNIFIQSVNIRFGTDSDIVYDQYNVYKDTYLASNVSIDNSLRLITKDKYFETGQTLTSIPKVNEQVISVDNYVDDSVFPNELSDSDNFVNDLGEKDPPEYAEWNYHEYESHTGYETFTITTDKKSMPVKMLSFSDDTYGEEAYGVLVLNPEITSAGNESTVLKSKTIITPSIVSGQSSLTLSMEAMVQFSMYNYRQSELDDINTFSLQAYLKINGKYLSSVFFVYNPDAVAPDDPYDDEVTNYPPRYGPGRDYVKLIFRGFEWVDEYTTFPLIFTTSYSNFTSGSPVAGSTAKLYNYSKYLHSSEIEQIDEDEFYNHYNYYSGLHEDKGTISHLGEMTLPTIKSVGDGNGYNNQPLEIEFGVTNDFDPRLTVSYQEGSVDGRFGIFNSSSSLDYAVSEMTPAYILIEEIEMTVSNDVDSEKIEFVRQTDDSWKESGDDIDLLHGTSCMYNYGNYDGNPLLERGSMHVFYSGDTDSYVPINSIEVEKVKEAYADDSEKEYEGAFIHDNGKTGLIEDLLMDSVMANRGEVLQSVTASLENRTITPLTTIGFEDMSGSKFMFTGGDIDLLTRNISGTWKEIKPD